MQRRRFDLSLDEAIDQLNTDYEAMRKEPRGSLKHVTPDDAYEAGFLVALQSLRSYTGPDPSTTGALSQNDLDLGDQFATDDIKETR